MRFAAVTVVLALSGCAWINQVPKGCEGPADKIPCTCNGATSPDCSPPLNDDTQIPFGARKRDAGVDQ